MLASLLATVIATVSPGYAPSIVHAGLSCASAELVPARTSLAIDTSALREEGAAAAIAQQVHSAADTLLRQASVVLGGGAWESVVAVTVLPLSGPRIGYQSSISVERGIFGYPSEVHELRCELCTEGELVVQLVGALDRLVPELVGVEAL